MPSSIESNFDGLSQREALCKICVLMPLIFKLILYIRFDTYDKCQYVKMSSIVIIIINAFYYMFREISGS